MVTQFKVTLHTAFEACAAALPEVFLARKRVQATALDQWKELDKAAIDHLLRSAPHEQETIATQLSDILPLPSSTAGQDPAITRNPRILSVRDARRITQAAYQGDLSELASRPGQGIVLWAPPDPRALGRLMAAFKKHPDPAALGHLRILVPMELYPGCRSPATIRDLFHHPLVGNAWADFVRQVQYITHPTGVLISGQHGPILLRKGLLIATVSTLLPRQPPALQALAEPLGSIPQGPTFLVDYDADLSQVVENTLGLSDLLAGATIGRPERCPTSLPDNPRLRIEISFPPDTAEVDALLGLRYLRNHGLPPHTLYGNKTLYADRSALLLQVTAAAAAVASWTLCEQMVVVSPTLALVKTDADPAMWRAHMDRVLQEDPTVAALQLKFKASWEGGRTFVVPTATPAQMAATRRTR